MGKVMFIGGPGNISTSTAWDVLKMGHELAIFTYPDVEEGKLAKKAKFYKGNRNETAALFEAFTEFGPDFVVDFCCFDTQQAFELYPIVKGRLKQFIFISTVDVYGYPLSHLPMRETDPWNPTNCVYAENKRLVEVFYKEKLEKEDFPLTIVRPAYSMGNNFVLTPLSHEGGKTLIPRLRAGKPVFVPGDGTTLIHLSVAKNTGLMIACLIGNDKSVGNAFTCGHEYAITFDEYFRLFASALGVESQIVHIPVDVVLPFSKVTDTSLLTSLTMHNVQFSIDNFKASFPGFVWQKNHQQAITEYIEYNDRCGNFNYSENLSFEDLLCKAWMRHIQKFNIEF
jgi:hypothetical protein